MWRLACCVAGLFLSGCALFGVRERPELPLRAEVVVVGGTSAGVAAAVELARSGHHVLLLVNGNRLGGMSAAGLGQTDTGNPGAIGGLAREFYARIHDHYADDAAWSREKRDGNRSFDPASDVMWRFEPQVAEAIFRALVEESGADILWGSALDRESGVVLQGDRVGLIRTLSGQEIVAEYFIDATYEGDLMAAAGIPYAVGREANELYGETLNGVQHARAKYHQFEHSVDPWRVPGDPSSGLLPGVHGQSSGLDGEGDERVQAYNFRLCLTDDPDNQIPFERPAGYDELDYELLLRNFEAGERRVPWYHGAVPNRKTDTNNNHGFSTDYIGANWDYPEASDERRAEIVADHERYQRGLLWTLANHPRVPAAVREEVSRWGLAADEFTATDGWPHQIYVREGRRMVSDYVVTEHECLHRRAPDDPIGLGAYNMDSHHVQRFATEAGQVRNEGDVQVPPAGPYPISYRAIVPPRGSVSNLLVPVGLSASHIAYGSIRMEPVFMILAQSAAVAAGIALEQGIDVQDVPYAELRARLLERGQVLPAPREAESLRTGLKIGEVGEDRAIVWARRTRETSTDPAAAAAGELSLSWWPRDLVADRSSSGWAPVTEVADGIRQFALDGLEPNTRYALELHSRAAEGSPIETLRASFSTTPSAEQIEPVEFVVITGQDFDRRDRGEDGHGIYESMLAMKPDFLIHTGDVLYYDKGDPKARDVETARFKWHRMYSLPLQRQFHLEVPSYFLKDDHDVLKDDCWPGQVYGDLTFEQGIEVFREQVPTGPSPYRRVRWGKHLELWLLEGREFRSPNDAPEGPQKTILGAEQFAWLEQTLSESDATHRVVVSATPVVGPDRESKADNHSNRAFAHEGARLRELLASELGVVVVCGDRHWKYTSVDPVTSLREFSCGPTTDAHAGGFTPQQRTDAHRFLEVRGGFLSVSLEFDAYEAVPTLVMRHHDTEGQVLSEERLSPPPR